MRVRLWMVWLLALGSGMSLRAQNVQESGVFAPLQHGQSLVIWWIEPTTAAQRAQLGLEKIVPSVPRLPLNQRTTSELGQNASTFGQNSSNYGQTASSYGANAGSVGQTAGSYGTSASNIGRNASDTGQSASDYGQAASTLGQTASTFGVAASDTDKVLKEMGPTTLTASEQQFGGALRVAFPELNVRMVAVPDVELKDKLTAAAIAGSSPDVVMADRSLPEQWRAIAAMVGVTMLGEVPRIRQEFSDQAGEAAWEPGVAILLRAPHPEAARAFVAWLGERQNIFQSVQITNGKGVIAELAVRGATAVLSGAPMVGADLQMARFSAELALRAATGVDAPGVAPVLVDVVQIAANERFAVVTLRGTMASAKSFGLVYPLVVMRRNDGGKWQILHISVGLTQFEARHAEAYLRPFAQPQVKVPIAEVTGLQPRDGDTRSATPDLGWEHGEGGGLFVVEWQMGAGGGSTMRWTNSHLYFVPDEGMRSQTRVNAQFAEAGGLYRWRVWVLGSGGTLRLSAWQSFTVVGR